MTANDISRIPGPLRDRMEIITIAGYTPNEKLQIAKRYLLKKAIKNSGLLDYEVTVPDNCLSQIIRGYTREAGVRELERMVNTVTRKIATEVVESKIAPPHKFAVAVKHLKTYLGPKRYDNRDREEESQVGLVNGLAWTAVGGELLNIEVVCHEGTGKLNITGKLGDVMMESAKAALSYVRSIGDRLGISSDWYTKNDIHIHVPDGATPKDGPSAGITMVTAITSAVTGIKIRSDVAMTGEVTIRGRVLPIGGLKEKLLAAKLSGIKTVIIPQKNEKDLQEVPAEIKQGMEILPCSDVQEVLKVALELARPEEFMKIVGLKVVETTPELKVAN